MAHEKLTLNIPKEWSVAQAKLEPASGVTSAGGLAHRLATTSALADSKRLSLGKFIELSRRRMRLSVEQLAERANVNVSDLLAIEKAENQTPDHDVIFQLAQVLGVPADPLLELAGLCRNTSAGLSESAIRFAARSEPMNALSKEEEEALNWFVKELAKTY